MKRLIKNIISCVYSLVYFSLTKLFNWNRFKFYFIERFSPNTEVTLVGNRSSILLGKRVTAHSSVKLKSLFVGKIVIEDNVRFNYGCILICRESIHIKKNVGFGPNVLLFDHDHDYREPGGVGHGATKFRSGSIEIGDNSWIGANVIILKNTKIGKNCVVAAGCILGNCEYPDNTMIYSKKEILTKKYKLLK